jgi:hypothetical protein
VRALSCECSRSRRSLLQTANRLERYAAMFDGSNKKPARAGLAAALDRDELIIRRKFLVLRVNLIDWEQKLTATARRLKFRTFDCRLWQQASGGPILSVSSRYGPCRQHGYAFYSSSVTSAHRITVSPFKNSRTTGSSSAGRLLPVTTVATITSQWSLNAIVSVDFPCPGTLENK